MACALCLATMVTNSCIFDAKEKEKDDGGGGTTANFKPLDKRDNLLFNLELAYNQRNINRYDEMLDTDFIYFFGATDISEGNVEQSQWGRDSEVASTGNLLEGRAGREVPPADRISLDVRYPEGEDVWTEVTPGDPEKYPGETWYEKTVDYNLTVVISEIDLTLTNSNPRQASFVVRWDEGREEYQVIQWRDDIGN